MLILCSQSIPRRLLSLPNLFCLAVWVTFLPIFSGIHHVQIVTALCRVHCSSIQFQCTVKYPDSLSRIFNVSPLPKMRLHIPLSLLILGVFGKQPKYYMYLKKKLLLLCYSGYYLSFSEFH